MKKVVTLATSLLLAGAMAVSFAGCDFSMKEKENGNGVIKGNYSEQAATQQELQTAFSSIKLENAFGDLEAEGWSLGVKLGTEYSLQFSMTETSLTGGTSTVTADASLKSSYELSVSLGEGGVPAIAGVGSLEGSGNYEMTGGIASVATAGKKSGGVTASLINDSTALYLAATLTGDLASEDLSSFKYTVSYEDLIGAFIGGGSKGEEDYTKPDYNEGVEDYPAELPTLPEQSDEGVDVGMPSLDDLPDFATLAGALVEYGFKVYLDQTDGLKVKISADADTVKTILTKTGNTQYAQLLTFDKLVFDFYLAFDKNGLFQKVSVNTDVVASMKAEGEGELSVTLKGWFSFETTNKTVKLPATFEADKANYLPFPMDGDFPFPMA